MNADDTAGPGAPMIESFRRLITDHADDRLAADLARPAPEILGHREQMAMIMNAVCCYLNPRSGWQADDAAAEAAGRWTSAYQRLQGQDGLFSSSGNVSSPPDSGSA